MAKYAKYCLMAVFISIALASFRLVSFARTPELTQSELKKYGMPEISATENADGSKLPPKYLLLDFYSAYCGVCQQTQPYFRQMQKALKQQIRFARIDADEDPQQLSRFGIEGTPGYVLYDSSGKPVYKMQQFISMEILFTQLQRYAGRLVSLDIPESLLKQENSMLTEAEQSKPHYTLIAIHPQACDACKTIAPFLNGMAIAKSDEPKMDVVIWNPDTLVAADTLKSLKWPTRQSYVLLDPEQHELVIFKGNPDPQLLWKNLSMLMDSGLKD